MRFATPKGAGGLLLTADAPLDVVVISGMAGRIGDAVDAAHHQMALASLDLVACVLADLATPLRAARRPPIEHRRGGFLATPPVRVPLAVLPIVHAIDAALPAPAATRPVDVLPRLKVLRQQAPCRSRAHHVTANIHQQPPRKGGVPRPPAVSNRSSASAHTALVRQLG